MMTYVNFGTFLKFMLFLVSMLLPIYSIAEPDDLSTNTSELNLDINNLQIDAFCQSDEEAFPEDAPLRGNADSIEPFLSFLDKPQEVISSGVEAFAKTLDEFFSDDKVFYETSGTYLRLRGDAVWNEKGDISYTGDIRLKLRLPHSKKKLKFILQSDADERPDEALTETQTTPAKAVEEKDYFAGIQRTIGDKSGWQFKPSLGIHLSSTIEPYIKLRLKRKYEFNKWSIHWNETPYWFDSLGWGFDSYLEFNRKTKQDDLFRASTFARWTHETDYFELSQTFSMFHTLSKRRAISYYVGAYGISEPTVYATHYVLGTSYRQNIHKDYLFFELIPQINYQKTNDFHAEHSLTFRLEMVFKK